MTPSSDPDQGPGVRRPGLPLGPALINRPVLHHLPLLSSPPLIPGISLDLKGRERLASGPGRGETNTAVRWDPFPARRNDGERRARSTRWSPGARNILDAARGD